MSKNFIFPAITAILLLSAACSNRPDSHNRQPGNEQVKESNKKELPAGAVGIKYNRHIYCEVMLHDSIPARMIFDTGCSTLVLDSTFYADTFGKERKLQSAMLGGAGDGYEQAYIDRNCWKYSLGKESMTEEMATVLNLRKIVGDNADGMFGMMFMQGKRVEINYADNYMCFLTAEEEIGEDFTRIPFTLDGMRIVLPLAITMNDGNVFDGKFLMDTGMPGTLSLNSTTADRLMMDKHLADARCMSYSVGGIGGDSQEFMFKTPQITIGGHAIKDLMITWSSNKEGQGGNTGDDGVGVIVMTKITRWGLPLQPGRSLSDPGMSQQGPGCGSHTVLTFHREEWGNRDPRSEFRASGREPSLESTLPGCQLRAQASARFLGPLLSSCSP